MTPPDLTIRSVSRAEDFAVAPGDDPDYVGTVAAIWEDGEGRPEWTFVAALDGIPVARVGYVVTDTVTDPAWLASLPPKELGLFGPAAWGEDPVATLEATIRRTIAVTGGDLTLELTANPERHPDVEMRRQLAGRLGLDLFQEKEGVLWVDHGSPITVPDRLAFRTIAEIGAERYGEVMARPGSGTLDRNDAWYYARVRAPDWAAQMLEFCDECDEGTWLIGEIDGDPVGYVAVSPFHDEGTATIVHIGVVPEHRGHGYIDDLLAAGTEVAREAGFNRILSDVDVLNAPMLAAMERAGHLASATTWHVWAYRGMPSSEPA